MLVPLLLLALSFSAPAVLAAGKNTLFTNSVSYCAEARAVLVDSFDIAYHRANRSATFSFSAASVENNLNLTANLYVNVYGIEAINQTFNLCDFVQGVLCPLPQVNFTGYGTYPIPESITKDIPAIAWTVPNLEGYARVTLTGVETGETEACLQATLSNGWSTRIPAVAWSTSMFTLAALLLALVHTALTNSPSPAQYRFFDVLFLFQTAASTGLLRLNYPLMYTAFVQNFHWALGLFSSDKMQNSINDMRHRTGGNADDTAYNAVQYINRKLSPYNTFSVDVNQLLSNAATFRNYFASLPADAGSVSLAKRVTVPTYQDQADTSDLMTGIPVYTNTLGIPQVNAFPTVFLGFLIFVAIAIAFHLVLFAVVFIVDRIGKGRRGTVWASRLRKAWWMFSIGNALRVCLICFFPILIFAFYQFTIGRSDSWLSILLAVIAILLVLVPLATVFVLSVIRSRRESTTAPSISPLYTSYKFFHSAGVLYRAYRQRYHFFWFAPLVLGMIAKAGFIAFGHNNAWAQVIGLMVVEAITFVSIVGFRPHKDRKGDWLGAFLSFCRLAAFGLLVAFIESVGVRPIPRTIIGFVIVVLFGIPAVLLLAGFFWNLGYGYLWRRHTHRIEDGLEVERFAASEDEHSSQRPAMTQVDSPAYITSSGQDAGGFATPIRNRDSSVMEPVGNNTYEAYGEPSSAQAAYAQAANGQTDMASRRTSGHSMYYTPQGVPQSSNNEYFAGNGTAQRY